MFEQINRMKLRFETSRGAATIEDVWDMPLTAKNGFSLDELAKDLNRKLKDSEEESFVTKTSAANDILALKFEAVKHIIAVKMAENAASKALVENKAKKDKILSIIAQKQDEKLLGASLEELQSMVESL